MDVVDASSVVGAEVVGVRREGGDAFSVGGDFAEDVVAEEAHVFGVEDSNW